MVLFIRPDKPGLSENYEHLMNFRLYDTLVKNDLVVTHVESVYPNEAGNNVYKIIKPGKGAIFISYPYEVVFSQLKHAAWFSANSKKHSFWNVFKRQQRL